MKVTVTGAGGYIGSVLVPMLLAAGHEVAAHDRFFFGETLAPHPRLTVRRQDSRFTTVADLEGSDALIDLVAISNDPSGEEFRNETLRQTADVAEDHRSIAVHRERKRLGGCSGVEHPGRLGFGPERVTQVV